MKTIHYTNKALLHVLGLDDMKFIHSVDVALRPRQLPEVTVRMTVDLPDGTDTQVFRLIAPLTAAPRRDLDLDAMCENARRSVRFSIEMAASRHLAEMFGLASGGFIDHSSKRKKVKENGRISWREAP